MGNFDKDEKISLLCSVLKPGGGGNGEMVGFKVELNLQLVVFLIHHNIRTRRTVNYGDITIPNIHALKKKCEVEAIKEPKTEAPTINLKDLLKTFEYLIQYLQGMIGGNGVLLSYIVRTINELHPNSEVDD